MKYTYSQNLILFLLRISIGWHFLYEGMVKMLKDNWSAYSYFMDSNGPFSYIFHQIANLHEVLKVVDILTIVGLTGIGFCLIIGFLTKYASICGMIFLLLIYLSHIPTVGVDFINKPEGNYLWVDRNVIEFFSLWVLILFSKEHKYGLDILFLKNGRTKNRRTNNR